MVAHSPNLLLIVLDTLRRDRLGVYGCRRNASPHLDSFAQDAALFERAIAPAQWTIPSHASMFTGLYPSAHQLTQANSLLSGEHPTLAEILQAAGYHTVAFCNNPLVGALDHGLARGFDAFYNYGSAVPQRPNEASRRLYSAFMRRFRPFARRVGNQFAQHDALFRMALNPFWVPIWTRYINFKGNTSLSIDDFVHYWRTHFAGGAGAPLFAFVNLMQSHLPFQPPQVYIDRVAPDLRRDRRAYAFMGRFNTDGAAWASPPDPPLEDWQQRVLNDFYDAEIAYQDEQLGRLFRMLEATSALDNTLVLITADHGESLGDHNLFGHGFSVHQELIHVPLLMRGTDRVPHGAEVAANVSTRRIFHTLLDAAGIQPPLAADDPNADVRGLSLLNALDGTDVEGDTTFSEAVPPLTFLRVIEHRNPAVIARLRLDQTWRAVYSGDDKLMLSGAAPRALYDVRRDPNELDDRLGRDAARAGVLAQRIAAFVRDIEGQASGGAQADVSDEVMDQLRALGYVD